MKRLKRMRIHKKKVENRRRPRRPMKVEILKTAHPSLTDKQMDNLSLKV